jgi:hypothetical protein
LKKALSSTTIADRFLFLFLLIASVTGLLYSREALSHGPDVVIDIKVKPVYFLSLETDREIVIEGTRGNALIEIKEGRVRMREAPCDNHICIKQGWITRGTIVCLPNNVVVIVGTGTMKHVDAITG